MPYSEVRRKAIIGGGPVRQVVPPFSCCPLRRDGEVHLDWEGEVQVDADVNVGGFSVSNVSVKVCVCTIIHFCVCAGTTVGMQDHIFLMVDPLSQERQPPVFLQVSIAVPVRFVTDSYVEDVGLLCKLPSLMLCFMNNLDLFNL